MGFELSEHLFNEEVKNIYPSLPVASDKQLWAPVMVYTMISLEEVSLWLLTCCYLSQRLHLDWWLMLQGSCQRNEKPAAEWHHPGLLVQGLETTHSGVLGMIAALPLISVPPCPPQDPKTWSCH